MDMVEGNEKYEKCKKVFMFEKGDECVFKQAKDMSCEQIQMLGMCDENRDECDFAYNELF